MESIPNPPNNALVPVPKLEPDFYDWYLRHEEKCRLVRERRDFQVVCLGDSITHMFELAHQGCVRGKAIWDRDLAPFRPLNLGFGWDRIQNVLWRVENGEVDGLSPALFQVLIGTNHFSSTANCRGNTLDEIAEGHRALVRKLQAIFPESRILVLGVFPRDKAGSALRAGILALNERLRDQYRGLESVRYEDIGDIFLDGQGEIPVAVMNDGTHPTEEGYRRWARAILPVWRDMGAREMASFLPTGTIPSTPSPR